MVLLLAFFSLSSGLLCTEKQQSGDPETGSGSPRRDQGRESQPQVAVALRRTPVKQGTPTLLPGRVRTRQELVNERTQDQNDDDSETVGHVTPASADTTRGLHIENTSTPCSSFATATSYEAPYDVLQASDIGQMTPYDDLGIHQAQVSQTDVKELVTNQ
ncbi:uncharacterized protein [Littorina saxatilis]|uniref:uncharacterized protein isoform X2 n=1 Tax=Littorina saxatilis TaxID=31220 RepID=UPI0038B5CECE